MQKNCMIWSWSCANISEHPYVQLLYMMGQNSNVDSLLIEYSWINVHGDVSQKSMSVRNMIHIIFSSTSVEECFPFTWKADIIHLLGTDWSEEPFILLLYSIQSLFDESSFPLWITSSLNHSDDFFFFCCFAHIHGYGLYCALWITLVGEKAMTCGKYLVLYMPQYTVYESEVGVCGCLVYWLGTDNEGTIVCCPWLVHVFFACGLACKVGWLEENYRAALTRCYHVSSVTATRWCELCCFV